MYKGLNFSWNEMKTDHRIYTREIPTQPDSPLRLQSGISGALPDEARRKFSSPGILPFRP